MSAMLVAAAFSAHLGVDIKSRDDAWRISGPGHLKKIALWTLFSHTHDVVVANAGYHCVELFGEGRQRREMDLSLCNLVIDVKRKLASNFGVHPQFQKLICRGKPLQDNLPLEQQGVKSGATMLMVDGSGPDQAFYIDDNDLDPQYNFDFTGRTNNGQLFERGGYQYTRPYGWNRAALKVLGRYNNDVWLGNPGIRTDSTSGEWAVSYHGTTSESIGPISSRGYDTGKCTRDKFGPGIYSTPSPEVATKYAISFPHKGKSYRMMVQNRVNLNNSNIVPEEKTGVGAAYFVTPNDEDIRPYGVCLKQA